MKKFSALLAIMIIAFGVNAWADKVLDPTTNYAYLEDTKVQPGSTVDIKLLVCAENQDDEWAQIGTVIGYFQFPEGVTINSVTGNNNACNFNPAINKVVLGQCEGKELVCTVNITVPADMPVGNYDMSFADFQIVAHNAQDDAKGTHTTTLTVQKAAVVEELGAGNSVSIVPVAMKPGFYADGNVTALDIYYTSKTALAGLSFNLNLPHAEFYSSAFDEEGNPVVAVLNNNVYNNSAKTLSVETVDDQNLKIAYTGVKTTRAANQRYIKAADVPTKLATIYIESEESLPADIYTLTLSDIKLEEYVTAGTGALHTGKNYSTIVVGTPEQNEAIIYGYCTSSAASAISTALKNVAIADVTAATVDDGAKFTDVLVNEKGGNSYYTRTSANYGTTVLPLDLTTENVDELYRIESMDANSIVLTKVGDVAANTPCIFKGTINVEGATPTLGDPSEQGLGQTTFKGTYEATEIADGAGYYISSNGKFYGDGATIRPFRAYFDGTIAGVKSFNVLLDTEDGLIDITNQFSEEDIYSLQGIKMNKAKKGVNIINGKKILKK